HRAHMGALKFTVIENSFEYDNLNREKKLYQSINGSTPVLVRALEYDVRSNVVRRSLGGTNTSDFLQKIDYQFDLRGGLTSINNVNDCNDVENPGSRFSDSKSKGKGLKGSNLNPRNAVDDDIFSMKFYYDQSHAELSFNPQFNGNISGVEYRDGCESRKQAYAYNYDNHNRLVEAKFSEQDLNASYVLNPSYDVDNISYDENGNILSLNRNGLNDIDMDILNYSVGMNNQLEYLEELGNANNGYIVNSSDGSFDYDANGNMLRNNGRSFNVKYNHLNLPVIIGFDNQDSIINRFDANGIKLQVLTKSHLENDWTTKTYIKSFIYEGNDLQSIHFEDGRVVKNGNSFQYEYSLKDHLGNTRAIFSDLDQNGEIDPDLGEVLQRNHYYPFGLEMDGPWSTVVSNENEFKYNGKELEKTFDLGWYDYHARWYEPAIGRWHTIDPHAESYYSWSSYNYVYNNPVIFIDPDGMDPEKKQIYFNHEEVVESGEEISNLFIYDHTKDPDNSDKEKIKELEKRASNMEKQKEEVDKRMSEIDESLKKVDVANQAMNMTSMSGQVQILLENGAVVTIKGSRGDLKKEDVAMMALQYAGVSTANIVKSSLPGKIVLGLANTALAVHEQKLLFEHRTLTKESNNLDQSINKVKSEIYAIQNKGQGSKIEFGGGTTGGGGAGGYW
ncbi:MAG: hypothetical protein MRY83_08370, partial [Flavobacteriales bacterium]|nr:hypothetical protein [Flavobacteriales bacterium]